MAGSSGTPPSAPGDLADAGRGLYEAIVGDVAPGYELDARELAVLERASRLADLAAELEATIAERGLWVEGSTGQDRLNPAVPELRQCHAVIASLLAKVDPGAPAPKTGHLNRRQRNQLRDVLGAA